MSPTHRPGHTEADNPHWMEWLTGLASAALLSARRARPRLRVLFGALIGFTIFSAAAALAPTFWFFGLMLIPTGLFALTVVTTAKTNEEGRFLLKQLGFPFRDN